MPIGLAWCFGRPRKGGCDVPQAPINKSAGRIVYSGLVSKLGRKPADVLVVRTPYIDPNSASRLAASFLELMAFRSLIPGDFSPFTLLKAIATFSMAFSCLDEPS